MGILKRAVGLVWLVGGILAMQAVPAWATRQMPCPQHGSKPIASDRQAIVYDGLNSEGLEEVFGCTRGAKRRFALGPPAQFGSAGGAGIDHVRIAGPVVAYEQFRTFENQLGRSEFRVVVRDLRTGRVVHRVPTGVSREGNVGAGAVDALVASSDGSAAWIRGDVANGEDELRVVDRSGAHVLASGGGFAPRSLAARMGKLFWVRNGKRFSYTFR